MTPDQRRRFLHEADCIERSIVKTLEMLATTKCPDNVPVRRWRRCIASLDHLHGELVAAINAIKTEESASEQAN